MAVVVAIVAMPSRAFLLPKFPLPLRRRGWGALRWWKRRYELDFQALDGRAVGRDRVPAQVDGSPRLDDGGRYGEDQGRIQRPLLSGEQGDGWGHLVPASLVPSPVNGIRPVVHIANLDLFEQKDDIRGRVARSIERSNHDHPQVPRLPGTSALTVPSRGDIMDDQTGHLALDDGGKRPDFRAKKDWRGGWCRGRREGTEGLRPFIARQRRRGRRRAAPAYDQREESEKSGHR